MLRNMLHAKIHRARVTGKSLEYPGSITIDPVLLEASGIAVEEQVAVANLSNGARFETYAIAGKRASGQIELNGAAARLAEVGDLVIIMAYALVDADDLDGWSAKIVHVDSENRPADN